ncbi:unnamed protein product [Clonostachys rosea]|uniref:Protein kinase domain-containing protein n=1 Tax=Bionectria ochroleuca TaxID=29856 RepID=A0ABY6V0G0_BIOOC|nr:unnamed protein product [Clonostachys rosea]
MENPLVSPYYTNNIIDLKIKSVGKKSSRNLQNGSTVSARIVKTRHPSTMSVVMVVELLEPVEQGQDPFAPGPPRPKLILKMFDRRFSPRLREELDLGPATRETEGQFNNFLDQGGMPAFIPLYQNARPSDSGSWTAAQKEAYFALYAAEMSKNEVRAYDYLIDVQGDAVPTFHADVQLSLRNAPGKSFRPFAGVEGVLFDYIPGFPLSELPEKVPEAEWPAICNQAIEKVNMIVDRAFINPDTGLRNSIVSRGEGDGQYKVYYIDFGLCSFRDTFDDDEMWRERKRQAGEEGKIGYNLTSCLAVGRIQMAKKKYKGRAAPRDLPPMAWRFVPSNRFAGKTPTPYSRV